ncbi:MAG: metal ABC transporter permease [Myxococcaceae bacterium]|nr:metal ABC transporter permease [Myxococcaceae bacterium]
MFWPFMACLLLAGIHVYLGIHILARQVVFVDLALAQMAALGSIVGIVVGISEKGTSLLFALLGAALLTFMQSESWVGICYATALSATILLSTHMPHGADELRELLSGNILWVEPNVLGKTALIYASVGFLHWLFRKKILAATFKQKTISRKWDFFFYASFAVVVTSSVSIAGVLLVFSFLIMPAVASMMFARTIQNRLLIGWGIGASVSMIGMAVSYYFDLPSGPAIVLCFAIFLMLLVGVRACCFKRMS